MLFNDTILESQIFLNTLLFWNRDKFEIRISKLAKQIRKSNDRNSKTFEAFEFKILKIVSSFVFRISDFSGLENVVRKYE